MGVNASGIMVPPASRAKRMGGNVLARFLALAAWKMLVVIVTFAAGATGVTVGAAGLLARLHEPKYPTPVVVLDKITTLKRFDAAEGRYSFDYNYTVSKGFLFFTGEKIQLNGSGTDAAVVDFSKLTSSDLTLSKATSTVVIMVPHPQLAGAVVDLDHTTLREHDKVLTHFRNFVSEHPQDAAAALADAQAQVARSAAQDGALITTAENSTRDFLTPLMEHLGFKHVTVVFT
jgi:hypothetical protein